MHTFCVTGVDEDYLFLQQAYHTAWLWTPRPLSRKVLILAQVALMVDALATVCRRHSTCAVTTSLSLENSSNFRSCIFQQHRKCACMPAFNILHFQVLHFQRPLFSIYIGWQWRNFFISYLASCFPPFCGASSAKCFLLGHHFPSKIALIRTFS